MKITTSELKEMLREAIREELNAQYCLTEGIFDSKQKKADFNNALSDFNSEVSKIAGKLGYDSMEDIAFGLVNLLDSCLSEYKVQFMKDNKRDMSQTAITSAFTATTDSLKKGLEAAVKSLSKITNFQAPCSTIEQLITKVTGEYIYRCPSAKKVEKFEDILIAVSEVTADKNVKAAALKALYVPVIKGLTDMHKSIKSKGTLNWFDKYD